MNVTVHSPFKAPPSISKVGFLSVLERTGSFSADALWEPTPRDKRAEVAARIYDYINRMGHDPARWLAILGKESSFGANQNSVLWRNSTRSWTNARSIRNPQVSGEIIKDEQRNSHYVRYTSVLNSVRDGIYRVDDPEFAYQQAGATTIAEVIAVWAPAEDANDPSGYAQTMVDWINQWTAEFPIEEDAVSVAEKYGIRGLQDSRHRLFRRSHDYPSRRRSLRAKKGVIVHYAGADQPIHSNTDMQLWRSYANDTWGHAAPGRFGPGLTVDGLQYHVGISRDGEKHLFQDIELDRWHCGSWPENGEALAINLPIGGSQYATQAQLDALTEVVSDWIAGGHGDRSMVRGHQEVDWTSCPGTLMESFILPFREGVMTTEKGKWFPKTEKYVGGGFWSYWSNNGGLRQFGYPLTNEMDEEIEIDGKKKIITAQYFERAVFEFHADHDEPNRVLLRRLGSDALKRKESA